MKKVFTVMGMLLLMAGVAFAQATPDLFFSEYIEGSSYNKALEIYNPTDTTVDLTNYRIMQSTNGGGWRYIHTFPAGASITPGDVWVIVANQINVALFDTANADEVLSYPSVVHYNGDDARAIIKIVGTDTLWLDIFGDANNDPGTGWPVAGVNNGTADHTLVRKPNITKGNTDWVAAFGTNADDSEWIVYERDVFTYLGWHTVSVQKEFVDVTFIANTATVPDTLGPNSVVQIRGEGGPLTWDGNSPTRMTNIGGDYWQVTLQFKPDEDVQFKFYTNANTTIAGGVEWEHQGWEGDVATGNRQLKVGAADTTLPLQFVNGWKSGAGQYEPPFTTTDSTTTVWVRVNMQGWDDFNAASQQIGIRGSNQVDWGQTGELSWGKTHLLNPESDHPNGGSQQYSGRFFYSNAVHVPNKYIGSNIQFKVVVHNAGAPLDEDWGNMIYNSGREDVVAVNVDTTAYWFWFDNKRPTVVDHKDVVIVEFVADMKNAIDGKGFAFGDTLEVRSGYYGTATGVTSKIMRRQGFTTRYSAIDTVTTTIGAHLDYQYYKIKNGIEYREIYYNFLYTGLTAGEAERRVVDPIAGATIKVEDILDSSSEVHRMPLFRNTALLARDVLVTFECDARPAIYQVKVGTVLDDIQGNLDISDPNQVLQLGVAMNGPATGGWGTWGAGLMTDTLRQMFDDGTHGDRVAGDSIYTIQIQYKGGVDVIGQEFKFGIGGGDNEGGYGNNHIENIDDTNPTFTLSAQFGSIDPVSYYTWNFNTRTPTSVKETVLSTLPTEFSLDQNYPNPFNPTTQIMYSLPRETAVTLSVYNTRGQKVATLVSKKQAAGVHQVSWTAQDDNGVNLPTGLYFYRLEAGEFSTTKKMLLVK